MIEEWLGIGFAAVTLVVVGFQVAVALGAPYGEYTMGGRIRGRLPLAMRALAALQALILISLAVIVLSAAGLLVPDVQAGWPWLAWVAVAFSATSVLLNAATRSRWERTIWLPVAIVMLACSLGVAIL